MTKNKLRLSRILDIHPKLFRTQLLSTYQEANFILFDGWQFSPTNDDWLLAWGEYDRFVIQQNEHKKFIELDLWLNSNKDWKVGYINYDLKNIFYPNLQTREKDTIQSDLLYFFIPNIIFRPKGNQVEALYHQGVEIPDFEPTTIKSKNILKFDLQISKDTYLRDLRFLLNEINQNRLQEINYCIEWQSDDILQNPSQAYYELQEQMQAPFSCYLKINDTHLLCNSPERYLKKKSDTLLSQPIKGTSPKFEDKQLDEKSKNLLLSHKEQTENILAAELVKADFQDIAQENSINISELAQIHSYNTVHQLVSTIECKLKENINFTKILKATFPMGSMTGLPKQTAVKVSEELETMHRDIYSGSVGFFTPEDDFDFNVVIRSLIYFQSQHKSYLRAGSGITAASNPNSEWEECLLKAKKIIELFS